MSRGQIPSGAVPETQEQGPSTASHNDLYGSEYYDVYIGSAEGSAPPPYQWGEPVWEGFFGRIATELVAQLQPKSALDAGCALGFLVKALRDRGVDAAGLDTSTWAIAQIPAHTASHCRVGSITAELERDYDLIACIEVLEHVSPEEAEQAVANLCRHSKAVLFSSTPEHFEEVTHINVRPPDYWAALFARHRFYRDWDFDAGFVSPHAVLFHPVSHWRQVVAGYERRLWDGQREVRGLRAHRDHLFAELQQHLGARDELKALLNTKTFRLSSRARALWARSHAPAPMAPSEPGQQSYGDWVRDFDTLTDDDRQRIRQLLSALPRPTAFSVLMPVFNPPEEHLRAALDSVLGQLYDNWQLCLADDASTDPAVGRVLSEYCLRDQRIKLTSRHARGHIVAATNSALELADGDYVVLLDNDDLLPEHALACLALEVDRFPETAVIFSDEDKLNEQSQRIQPYFKPPWNPDLILGQNYVSHLGAFRRDLVLAVGRFREGFEGSQDYDLVLRIAEQVPVEQIRHLPLVLYHWRAHSESTARSAAAKPYAEEASRRAVQEHLQRLRLPAQVGTDRSWSGQRVRWRLPDPPPRVRVLVGGRDLALQQHALTSLRLLTDYPALTLEAAGETFPFFTADDGTSTQAGVVHEGPGQLGRPDQADAICALLCGVEAIEADWLKEMASLLFSPGVGVVGARIEDRGGAITRGPLTTGAEGDLLAPWDGTPRLDSGYFGRAWLPQSVASLVPGAIVVRSSVLAQIGGLDTSLDANWRTVDLCLKARSRGWRVVWTPAARLLAAPGVASWEGLSKLPPVLLERHRGLLEDDPDPAYSPNLSLGPRGGFTPARPPRQPAPWRHLGTQAPEGVSPRPSP
ncbi:MAG: glycosyltransferase [Candidatus Dormibacteria bacterium]